MSSLATWWCSTAWCCIRRRARPCSSIRRQGPIAAIAPRDAYQDAVLGFEIVGQQADGSKTVNTNWTRQLSFPTFCLNLLEFLGGRTEDSQNASTRPGRPVELRAAGNAPELTVVDPTGKQFAVQAQRRRRVSISRHQPGGRVRRAAGRTGDRAIRGESVRPPGERRAIAAESNGQRFDRSAGRYSNRQRRRGGNRRTKAIAHRSLEMGSRMCSVRSRSWNGISTTDACTYESASRMTRQRKGGIGVSESDRRKRFHPSRFARRIPAKGEGSVRRTAGGVAGHGEPPFDARAARPTAGADAQVRPARDEIDPGRRQRRGANRRPPVGLRRSSRRRSRVSICRTKCCAERGCG